MSISVNHITNNNDMYPDQDNSLNIGAQELRFKDLFVAGNIGDGVNLTTLANLIYATECGAIVPLGITEPLSPSNGQLFYRTDIQALKIFISGIWYILAQVTFDSLWNSATDFWDSNSMDWNSPS